MVIDLPTLIMMTLVNLTIASVAAICVFRVNRPIPGLGQMVYGIATVALGFAISSFAHSLAGKLASWVGSTAMVLGMFLIFQGIREFRGLDRISLWLVGCLSVPYLSVQTYFLLSARDNLPLRHFVFASLVATLCFGAAWAFSTRVAREDRYIHGVTAAGLILYGFAQTIRAIWVILPGQERAADGGFLPIMTLMVLNVCLIGCLLGLTIATNLKLRKRIENLAFCDPLTGLPNRRAFDDRLDRAQACSLATGSTVALIYIDLDNFKTINDRFGHSAGDVALKQVADRLRGVVHPEDCFARMGGDEFVVLTERFHSRHLALALIVELQNTLLPPIDVTGIPVQIGISCGLAFYPDDVSHTSDLIRDADAKMYVTKRRVPVLG